MCTDYMGAQTMTTGRGMIIYIYIYDNVCVHLNLYLAKGAGELAD